MKKIIFFLVPIVSLLLALNLSLSEKKMKSALLMSNVEALSQSNEETKEKNHGWDIITDGLFKDERPIYSECTKTIKFKCSVTGFYYGIWMTAGMEYEVTINGKRLSCQNNGQENCSPHNCA